MLWNLLILLLAVPASFAGNAIEPEVLDSLLAEGRYEEFAELMGIEDVNLVRPSPEGGNPEPMFNKGLEEFDILLTQEQQEQARQGIRFDKYPGSKWQNGVPFVISNDFNRDQRQTILTAIRELNRDMSCNRWTERRREDDYVFIFSGDGCYSYLGKVGGQQALSLNKHGCMSKGTMLHEFQHAAGVAHEHNRWDRDDFVEVLWNNIPEEWQSQYQKTDPQHYGLQGPYDYYSIMHYPMKAPGTNKDAFRIKKNGVQQNRIGTGQSYTTYDQQKIKELYCGK